MHVSRAVITGSCALDMLTGEPTVRTNINFIVPYGCSTGLYAFILETLKYRRVTTNRRAHVSFESTIHTFARFQQAYNTITVTEATPQGIFKVLMASPTTADMIIMTAGGLAAFYPKWTLAGITLTNHTFIRCLPVGCVARPPFFQIETTTKFLNGPCGAKCPTLWCNIAQRGSQSLMLDWDRRYSLVSYAMHSQTMWRLSEHCGNPACVYNPLNNAQTAHLPPNPMPADRWSICIQEARIANNFPVSVISSHSTSRSDTQPCTAIPWQNSWPAVRYKRKHPPSCQCTSPGWGHRAHQSLPTSDITLGRSTRS